MESPLADFICTHMEAILNAWESYARTLTPAGGRLTSHELRDRAHQILEAIQNDLRNEQTRAQAIAESWSSGVRERGNAHTAAETHALLRALDGFSLSQLVAEYRALRASVLDVWMYSEPTGPTVLIEVGRFNEAIDQAVAESVAFFSQETERWRHVFLGVLAHELRSPLDAILLTAQLVARQASGTPLAATCGRIERHGRRMADLITDLIEYNRAALGQGLPAHRALCDLGEAVEAEVDMLRTIHPKAQIDLARVPCEGDWDASRMKQVVANLVNNAVRYGARDTPIQVTLRVHDREVYLFVVNTGPTIEPELQKAMFEPLRRCSTEHTDQGMGLGLYIVREIVRGHGGTVDVTSEQGKTTFAVRLPLHSAAGNEDAKQSND